MSEIDDETYLSLEIARLTARLDAVTRDLLTADREVERLTGEIAAAKDRLDDFDECKNFQSEPHTIGKPDQWLILAWRILSFLELYDVAEGLEKEFSAANQRAEELQQEAIVANQEAYEAVDEAMTAARYVYRHRDEPVVMVDGVLVEKKWPWLEEE